VNAFIDHLYTPLGSTSNYSAIANPRTSQTPKHPLSPFPACCVFISRSLATASNSGVSSASRSQVPPSQPPCRTQLSTELTGSSQSQSYITNDGQPASLSWNKAPIWDLRPDRYYCQTVAGLLVWGALSDERTGLAFAIATGSRQSSHFRVRVP
jgi:hypothetical protein